MNEKIKAAYKKINKMSLAARTQLFTIPITRQIQYRTETNKRWIVLVASAVSNRQRQKDRLHESLSTMTNYFPARERSETRKKSSQAEPYESPTYKQTAIEKYYEISDPLIESTQSIRTPEEFPTPRIHHRKFKNSRITSYYKCKPD